MAPRTKDAKILEDARRTNVGLVEQVGALTIERDKYKAQADQNFTVYAAADKEANEWRKLADGREQTIRDLTATIASLERFNPIQTGYVQRVLEDEAVRELGAARVERVENNETPRRRGPQQQRPPWHDGGWASSDAASDRAYANVARDELRR